MELVHPDEKQALYEEYESTEGKVDYNYRIRHRDGHWVHVREISVDIKDEAGNYIESMGTLQDVSELKEAQIKAERANQAKNEFLSRMSHELRTPLNAVLGFSQLIESDQSLNEEQRSKGSVIFKAGRHLLNLINDVLDLSRLEAGNIEISSQRVALQEIVRESISLVSEMAQERDLIIDCNLESFRGLMVEADATRLKQVFLNLLSNAVKYNREGGRIGIDNVLDNRGLVSINITDTGPGIAADKIDELFEPFNRLGAERGETEGTGIGLVITRQLVELMRGEFRFDSTPGEGSTFTVQLRQTAADFSEMDSQDIDHNLADPLLTDSKPTMPRVLVAEDNPVNQKLIAEQLKHLGFCADYASTGVEALALWKSGNYPLLLTDIRMPKMNGHELIRQIRALQTNSPRRPIIAITANTMKSDIDRCFDSGADDVISKPLVLDALKLLLHKWLPGNIADGTDYETTTKAPENASDEAIDLSILSRSVGDNTEVHRRLLKSYIEALPKALYDIRQAYAWHNLEQLGAYAHKLKSSSRSLGATRIAQLCSMIELACRENRESEVAASLPNLQQAAESVTEFIEAFGTTPDAPVSAGAARPGDDDDAVISEPRVLLVDDDPIMHSVTTLVLNDLGVERVQSALSGARALEILERQQSAIDIIFCDLNMPEMDGIEFTRHLARLNYPGSLVLLSGEDIRILRTVERLAIEHGLQVLGVLEKPVTRLQMQQLLASFDQDITDMTLRPVDMLGAEELSRAIADGEIDTYFQPKIEIKTQQIVGVEMLARWIHPAKGVIGPGAFIPMAEEYNLIQDLTDAVCEKALHYAASWKRAGMELDVALNISVDSLTNLEWPNEFAARVDALGLQPNAITLEITESRLMEHVRLGLEILGRLRLKRFNLSIDDFGTGYSSMEQLQRIPFSELKIDRAFVRAASDDVSARAILESSVLLARKLDMRTVAEGVETEQDWNLVEALGCDHVQGYYIAKPMPGDELCDWLAKQKIKARS